MSETRFRILLSIYIACFLISIAAIFLPADFSFELAEAYTAEPQTWLVRNYWFLFSIAAVYLCVFVAGLIGLFRFRQWGRSLSLYSTIAGLVVVPFLGPQLSSSFESTSGEVATLLWGAVLAVAYFSPVSDRFSANNSFKPNPLRGSA